MVFSFLLWTSGGGGGGCLCYAGFFFFFCVDVFIINIISMSYLYYFNQTAKNITKLLWCVKR